MSTYHESTYRTRTTCTGSGMTEPFKSEIWFEFGDVCIDAPEFMPAGSSMGIDPGQESSIERFAAQSTSLRGL